MMYLDANFFIFALLDQTKKGDRARELQSDIITGKKQAITSVLAIDEVMWVLIKNNKSHLLRKAIEDIYNMANVEIKGVDPLIPLNALNFIDEFSLKPRDAFHVSIMELLRIKIIVSDDTDFDRIKEIKRIRLE